MSKPVFYWSDAKGAEPEGCTSGAGHHDGDLVRRRHGSVGVCPTRPVTVAMLFLVFGGHFWGRFGRLFVWCMPMPMSVPMSVAMFFCGRLLNRRVIGTGLRNRWIGLCGSP